MRTDRKVLIQYDWSTGAVASRIVPVRKASMAANMTQATRMRRSTKATDIAQARPMGATGTLRATAERGVRWRKRVWKTKKPTTQMPWESCEGCESVGG